MNRRGADPRNLAATSGPSRRRPAPRRGKPWVLAVASGVSWVLALPPVGWWPFAAVAVALSGAAARDQPVRRRAVLGLVVGLVVFGVTLRWATIFTPAGYVVLVIVQAGFVAAALAATPAGRGAAAALSGALALAEALRHRWPLSGLPVSGIDLTQANGPLLPLAGFVGPLGMVLVTAILGVGLLEVTVAWRRRDHRTAAAIAALVSLGIVAASLLPTGVGTHVAGGDVAVAVVQGGGARGVPAVRSTDRDVFQRHLDASRQMTPGVDLVLWPEDVVDVEGPLSTSREAAALTALASRLDATMVVGVVTDADDQGTDPDVRRFRNLAVEITHDGRIGERYDKLIRVPFGEYVPWRGFVDRFADLSLIPREAVPGTRTGVLDTSAGRLGVSISFEGLFATRARASVRAGAVLLVNPTNAASYVTEDVPAQQVAAGRLRAVETGRAVAIASPTGYSALIDPSGTVLDRSVLEQPAVLQGQLDRRSGRTPYVVTGDGPAITVAVILLTVGWRRSRPRS